jgi:serine/threonine protein kinase
MQVKCEQLGFYQLQEELGRGGSAIVYRAIDMRNNKVVALKILPPELAEQDSFLHRFIKEGRSATRLRHPNIVATYEAGAADGYHYIAMEYVHGGTLTQYIKARKELMPLQEALDILAQIADALDYAHWRGFIHRDIKLSNILMNEDGRVLLSDFGVAKNFVEDSSLVTAANFRIGTPLYMSPEQISGNQTVDRRSDVYSFGVLAYTLFTGRTPHSATNQSELMYKVVFEPPISPNILNPDLPPHVVHALHRVLAKDPDKRFKSAGEFVSALATGSALFANDNATILDETNHSTFVIPNWIPLVLIRGALVATLLVLLAMVWLNADEWPKKLALWLQGSGLPWSQDVSVLIMSYSDPQQRPEFWTATQIQWKYYWGEWQAAGLAWIRQGWENIWRTFNHLSIPEDWWQESWRNINEFVQLIF